jgi:nucleoside-diphosphate-sugar epimerase
MKVLLTGGSGFIGMHVLAALQDEGVEVVVIGRSGLSGAVRQIEADLLTLTQDEINELLRKECVTHLLHLAWVAEHGKYWTSPLNLRWVDATVRLVEAFCTTGGQHIVIAGTCAEYDWSYGYCREESTPLSPTTL